MTLQPTLFISMLPEKRLIQSIDPLVDINAKIQKVSAALDSYRHKAKTDVSFLTHVKATENTLLNLRILKGDFKSGTKRK